MTRLFDMDGFLRIIILLTYAMSLGLCDVTILVLCADDSSDVCAEVFNRSFPDVIPGGGVSSTVRAVVLTSTDDFMKNMRLLNNVASENDIGLLLGIGGSEVVNAVACVGVARDIVTMTYMDSHIRHHIYDQNVIKLNPDHAGLARALAKVMSKHMIANAFVICQDTLASDGFTQALADIKSDTRFNMTNTVMLPDKVSDLDLHMKLLAAHDYGYRLMVVHTEPGLFHRIVRVADNMSYFESGYAWIFTEVALRSDFRFAEDNLPPGLLAIDGYERDIYPDKLQAVIDVFKEEFALLLEQYRPETNLTNNATFVLTTYLQGHSELAREFKRKCSTNVKLFNQDGSRVMLRFRLLNYVQNSTDNYWKTVGFIKEDSVDLETVMWPGSSIFGPVTNTKETYIVVTRPAEPFLFVSGPVKSRVECPINTACLKMHVYSADDIRRAVEYFQTDVIDTGMFSIFCCEGIVIDIFSALSHQIDFNFVAYFHNDSDYGTLRNNTWTGMIGDVSSGAADIMAGAVSMTSDRAKAISFTESFFFSSFNMIATSNIRYTSLLAFTNPFDPYVWMTIICSATFVAIATSLFEWNSPFGLNPWGKKRKKNYSLGSGLTMVYSIWFGHTVSTKSPKSWPSKVLQNFWACLAIFILASYTANLAAFLAGSVYDQKLYSILDTELISKRVGAIKSTASDIYTNAVNAELHTRLSKFYVKDIDEGIRKIRSGELDLYMDDSPILEYALARQDLNCSIKFASHTFGDNAYSFGVKHGSWIKTKLDPYILNYVELGFVENLKWRYLGSHRQCQNKLISVGDLQFGLPQTKGLFVMLLMAIGVSILLLVCENIFYFLVLPILKRKPDNSIWKSRNVEYFSQRLYKAINSERVQHQAQVLVSKMRQKKFSIKSKMRRQTNTVPANLMSYMPRSESPVGYSLHNGHVKISIEDGIGDGRRTEASNQNGVIFSIANDAFYEEIKTNKLYDTEIGIDNVLYAIRGRDAHECYENPVFESDTDDDELETITIDIHPEGHRRPSEMRSCNSPYVQILQETKAGCARGEFCKGSNKKYETWPSPKTRRRSIKKVREEKEKDRVTNPSPVRTNALSGNIIVNELSVGNKKKCRACSFSVTPSYHSSSSQYELKDNRTKSSLRQNAMAPMPRSPSMSLDEDAVEVLSKEDLLILWKRSEIELQTKLNRMLQQNNHLRTLVDIVESNEGVRGADLDHLIADYTTDE